MTRRTDKPMAQGPFRAEGLQPDGYYEISHGHPVQLAPAGGRHGSANVVGALPLATDPMVTELGVDVGHALADDTVRAPDVSVGGVAADQPGWAKGAPPLAIEYADEGTNERDLQTKIEEYFGAGAKYVWVVRLVGPRRVQAYTSPEQVTEYRADGVLEAPGVLQEKIPAAALWDRRVALDVSLRNLLLRAGYKSLEHVREEAREAGREEGRQEGREEGLAQGVEQGFAMGRAQGREEGREEAELRLVVTLFESKLRRALSEDEVARLRAAIRAGHGDELARLALGDEQTLLARLRGE
jgi:Uma2 family endonuclease